MKLLVGLGNPGRKYEKTRHNVGFDVMAELASRLEMGRPKAKFNGEFAETIVNNEKIGLLCPLTYMNLSGQSVGAAVDFFKLSLDDVFVVCDDLNLPLGRLRIRPGGSAGGNNGLKDIIARLGSDQFARLRIGVGRPVGDMESSDYVLGRFSKADRLIVDESIVRAADAALLWAGQGTSAAMNRYNPDPNKPKKTDQNQQASGSKQQTEPQKQAKTDQSEKENQSG